jgi:chemotaxis protein CheZ
MPEPRKIFRIEETAAATQLIDDAGDVQAPLRHAELMTELADLRGILTALASTRPRRAEAPAQAETARLTSELNLIAGAIGGELKHNGTPPLASSQTNRIAHELEEIVHSTEQATQRVLAAAEEIDQIAKNLSAAMTGKFEQGLAQDIQDLVIRIFEACNFQDLAGQRVTKVLGTLNFVEDHVSRVLAELKNPTTQRNGTQVLHGPRLDGDRGHVSQADIDLMFGS